MWSIEEGLTREAVSADRIVVQRVAGVGKAQPRRMDQEGRVSQQAPFWVEGYIDPDIAFDGPRFRLQPSDVMVETRVGMRRHKLRDFAPEPVLRLARELVAQAPLRL